MKHIKSINLNEDRYGGIFDYTIAGYPSGRKLNRKLFDPITDEEIAELKKIGLIPPSIPSQYDWYHDSNEQDILDWLKDYRSEEQTDARKYNL